MLMVSSFAVNTNPGAKNSVQTETSKPNSVNLLSLTVSKQSQKIDELENTVLSLKKLVQKSESIQLNDQIGHLIGVIQNQIALFSVVLGGFTLISIVGFSFFAKNFIKETIITEVNNKINSEEVKREIISISTAHISQEYTAKFDDTGKLISSIVGQISIIKTKLGIE
jgi:hypothetical protein